MFDLPLRAEFPRTLELSAEHVYLSEEFALRPVDGGWRGRSGTLSSFAVSGFGASDPRRIDIIGVFGLGFEESGPDSHSVEIHVVGQSSFQFKLKVGEHFKDSLNQEMLNLTISSGVELRTLGCVFYQGKHHRVDCISIDVDDLKKVEKLLVQVAAGEASFIVLDVLLYPKKSETQCPFHSGTETIGLGQLGSLVRTRNRVQLERAIVQFEESAVQLSELDEIRSVGLTFLSVILAAELEMGASRGLHTFALRASRDMENCTTSAEVVAYVKAKVIELLPELERAGGPHGALMDQALRWIGRNYSKDISVEEVAQNIGLSPSYFRQLFRELTGQPFQQYVLGLRLERAKELLMMGQSSVQGVAEEVGFKSAAHFTRSFQRRFQVSPSSIRQRRMS